jgi:hypothetical protein
MDKRMASLSPRFRPSGPASASLSLPMPGAAQLLTLPALLSVPFLCAQNLLKRFPLGGPADPPTEEHMPLPP